MIVEPGVRSRTRLGRVGSRRHAFAVFLAAVIWAGCSAASHPTDQVMEQRLRSNRAEFDKLVAMLDEDRDLAKLDQKYVFMTTESRRAISKERLDEYRHLFRKLGLEGGMHREKDGAVRLIASSQELFTASSEKSYVYSRTPPSALTQSLDHVIRSDRGDQSPVFKKVADNWYLYYESW